MTIIEFRSLSDLRKATAFYEAHNRKSGVSYYSFVCFREDREVAPWEVHTYSTGIRQHCMYYFDTLSEAKTFVTDYLF